MTGATLDVILIAALVAASVPTHGLAQEPDSVVADTVPLYRLDGVTVTVTRTREEINRLPYAVGVLGAAEIRRFDATISLAESLVLIPGLFANNRYNFALGDRISIRGFGARSQFGVRGIRVIQDGIPLTFADGQSQLNNLDLSAAGRIEVIRGPSSALYGNASGGVISVQTEPAPPVRFGPDLGIVFGSFSDSDTYQKLDLSAAGQSGALDYTSHLSFFRTDGFRTHSSAKYGLFNTRLRYQLDPRSELTAVINYQNTPEAQNPSSLTDSVAAVKPDTARDIVLPPEDCPPDPGFAGCQDLGEGYDQGQLGILYTRRLAQAHQLSFAGYGIKRGVDSRIPFTFIKLDRLAGGLHAKYRFAPASRRFSGLTAGVDLDALADDRLENDLDSSGDVGELRVDQHEMVAATGLYALTGFVFNPDLELTLNLRYDHIRFEVEDHLMDAGNPDDSGNITMDQLSPLAGLRYTYASWLNVYANVGRSFQTPTTTELSDSIGGFNEGLRPERATNYEIGLKGTAAGRVSYGLSLYQADVKDQLIGSLAPTTERVFFTNAGTSTRRGIEASVTALLAQALTLTAAYTYSDFSFDDFETDAGDFSGNVVPGVTPHEFYVRVTYGHGSGFAGRLDVTVTDDYFVDNANKSVNDGYVVVDLRLAYAAQTTRFGIVPFIGLNNIFDQRYNSSVVVNAIAGRYYEPAPGRNVYAGLRVQYR